MQKILILAVSCLLSLSVIGQSKFWEGGLLLGASTMGGDLGPDQMNASSDFNLAFGLMGRKYLHSNLAFRFNLIHSRLSAGNQLDPQLHSGAFSTQTPLTELSVDFELDILGHLRRQRKKGRVQVSPYLFLGMGMAFTRPETQYSDSESADALLDEVIAFSSTRFALPVGAGLRVNLSEKWALALEIAPRATFSDYLDGISHSASPNQRDWYGFGSVQAWYKLSPPDKDDDGVPDDKDKCPTKPGSRATFGCPDQDGDQVADLQDLCPDLPGVAEFGGCPDTDGDGVADADDACPTQPGPIAAGGCPDTDGDGLADALDSCPEEPGARNNFGCPTNDLDKDGVNNAVDECPDLPGPAANNGCPYPDSDGDGVADLEDRCPNSIGTPEKGGCPEIDIPKDDQYLLDLASRNMRFYNSSERLQASSYDALGGVLVVMKKYPDFKLRIEGYTDNVGSAEFNLRLSQKRARHCQDYLISYGIDVDRIEVVGYGEDYPVATNITEEGRLQNQRVEFTLFR